MALIIASANPFLYCFYSKNTTENFLKMSDDLFGSNWQQLPTNLQKYFILMIANSNKPLFYHGSGIVVLDLETFRNVHERLKEKLFCWSQYVRRATSKCLQANHFFQIFRKVISFYVAFKALTDWNYWLIYERQGQWNLF